MTPRPVLQQRLQLLKQHHDELESFFLGIESDVEAAYRTYKVTGIAMDIVADVVVALVSLVDAGYKIAVLGETEVSKMSFAISALQFAYSPIRAVLQKLSNPAIQPGMIQPDLTGIRNAAATVLGIIGNVLAPSYWARVMANIETGHWKTAFTRNPEQEIWQVQMALKQQRAASLEKMEAQINKLEGELGMPLTFYVCKA